MERRDRRGRTDGPGPRPRRDKPAVDDPARRRRSLSHVGGEIATQGDEKEAQALAQAVDVETDPDADAPDRAHVHGFHAYPARAHPLTVQRLVESFAPEGGTVLDPFAGSGTVLVEAMLAGRDTIGTDLNPLAVMLARAKTYPRRRETTDAMLEAAQDVRAYADERRKAKAGATTRLPREDVELFAPHVLLELAAIRDGIRKAPPEHRPDLMLVLSSILVKMSQKRGDTSDEAVSKRIAAGYPAKLFLKKTEEWKTRLDTFASLLPSPPPKARVYEDDATQLTKVKTASVDTVVTSPPYAATYDYLEHHALRMRWLGLDTRAFQQGELGSRRTYAMLTARGARQAWTDELSRLLEALARVLRPGGNAVLLIADSATSAGPNRDAPEALRADEIVSDLAATGRKLDPIACASQARPHFHVASRAAFFERPRHEHAILLRRTTRR